ncbi:XkdX family protein [Terribacillus saccharophilus]|uniref:XkdX family protein n=1 Tax=Terribacillus saccharophilus TaxID=361277 RepID=UPI000C9A33B3|nr:XkdX family protein [Terribacillus goriensis]
MFNFWVTALYKNWATVPMVKTAYEYQDCSIEDLANGVEAEMVKQEDYKTITGEDYKEE